eukprot:m.39623 g.39623  ORF g.39623 m.39623 type:complete len:1192 (+) comp32773_c0_seq4:150-3725(+)
MKRKQTPSKGFLDSKEAAKDARKAGRKRFSSKEPSEIRIAFHALIPLKEWLYDPNNTGHKVRIKLNTSECHTVTLEPVEPVEMITPDGSSSERMFELLGQLVLPSVDCNIPYKYVVEKEGSETSEFLRPGRRGGDVERVLLMKVLQLSPGGYYDKYDGIIRTKPISSQPLPPERLLADREMAIRELLPKWKGFYSLKRPDLVIMSPQLALSRFFAVFDGLGNLPVLENKPRCKSETYTCRPDGLSISKILMDILPPKILELRDTIPSDGVTAEEKIVAAVAIAMVADHYKLYASLSGLSLKDCQALTACFVLPFDMRNRKCPAFSTIEKELDKKLALDAVLAACGSLCRSSLRPPDWILAMPLVHFLAGASEPFCDPGRPIDSMKPEWWGLCGMCYTEGTLKFSKPYFLAFQNCVKRLVVLDPFLERTILYACSFADLKQWIRLLQPKNVIRALIIRADKSSSPSKLPKDWIDLIQFSLSALTTSVSQANIASGDYESTVAGMRASVDLLLLLCARSKSQIVENSIILSAICLVFSYLTIVQRMLGSDNESLIKIQLRETAQTIDSWISRTSKSQSQHGPFLCYMKLWNEVLQVAKPTEGELQLWPRLVQEILHKERKISEDSILLAYCEIDINAVHSIVKQSLEAMTAEALEALSEKTAENQETAFGRLLKLAISISEKEGQSRWLLHMLFETCKGKGSNLTRYLEENKSLVEQTKTAEERGARLREENRNLLERAEAAETNATAVQVHLQASSEQKIAVEKEKEKLLGNLAEKHVIINQLQETCESLQRDNAEVNRLLSSSVEEVSRLRARCQELQEACYQEPSTSPTSLGDESLREEIGRLQLLLNESEREKELKQERLETSGSNMEDLRRTCQKKEEQITKLKQYDDLVQIAVEDVRLLDINLGKGAYGGVQIGVWRGCLVAVKKFHDCLVKDRYIDFFRQEMEINCRVRHPNILATCGVTQVDGLPMRIITKLLEGSLSDVINASHLSKPKNLTLREQTDLAVGFTSGLCYLHQLLPNAVLHGDIRSSNILVTALMEAQIADLGTARFVNASLSVGPHSSQYVAPERSRDTPGPSSKLADVYSLGVTLIELMTGRDPAKTVRHEQVEAVDNQNIETLCRHMIEEEQQNRISAQQCLDGLKEVQRTEEYNRCPARRMVKGKYHPDSGLTDPNTAVSLQTQPWRYMKT